MPRKTYNSESARDLAKDYKITLTKIPATRSDLKITVQNVKDYIIHLIHHPYYHNIILVKPILYLPLVMY